MLTRFVFVKKQASKMKSLERFAVKGFRRRELVEGTSTHNRCYLKAKREHGHPLPG